MRGKVERLTAQKGRVICIFGVRNDRSWMDWDDGREVRDGESGGWCLVGVRKAVGRVEVGCGWVSGLGFFGIVG